MPMDPRMMQPQGNVTPGAQMAGAPPGAGNPEAQLMAAAQAGDPRAMELVKQAKQAESDPRMMEQLQAQARPGQMAPQGPPPGAQMAGAPPQGAGAGPQIPPEAQKIMQAIKAGDPAAIQKLQEAARRRKQGHPGGGPQAGLVNPPAGAEGLGMPGMQGEMLDFIKQRMAEKQKVAVEEQAMKQYLMKALQEAQGDPSANPAGGGAAPMPGAGQSTVRQLDRRGSDIDAAVTAAGG